MKNNLMSAVGLDSLRDSLQGSETSSISITWTSECIPKESNVSEGQTVFAFLVVGMPSSMSSTDVAGVDALAELVLLARHLPEL